MSIIKEILREEQQVSLEARAVDILELNNISTESLVGFFKEFGAKTVDLTKAILPSFAERSYKDSVRRSSLVKTKIKTMNNLDLANIVIVVPESFSGNMIIYTEDLITAYDSIVDSTKDLLLSILSDISANINVSETGMIQSPMSYTKAKNIRVKREAFQKKISGMFNQKKPKSHSKVIDHFRSTSEVVDIYDRLASLERTLGKTTIDDILKLTDKLVKELNMYIEIAKSNEIDRKSSRAFKELTESVYEAAKDVEFIGYLQANALQLYKSIQDLGEKVNKYSR